MNQPTHFRTVSRSFFSVALAAMLASSILVAGCGDDDVDGGDMDATSDASDTDGSNGGQCTHEPTCVDDQIQTLDLFTTVNSDPITNEEADGVFTTSVDAAGGGLNATKSFVYAKFTDEGLVAVAVSDEDAFDSEEWDLAFRRFVIRLNSGISGPSCVTAARTAAQTDFDTLAEVPTGLEYRTEEYFTASCEYVPDGSGLGSPGVAMQSFWEYPGCVKMTGNVFVIERKDGRHVKFLVQQYYSPENQTSCNETGEFDMSMPSGAGSFVVKWAFLD